MGEEKKRQHRSAYSKERVCPHHLDPLADELQPQPHDKPQHHWPTRDFGNPANRTCQPHDQPEETAEQSRHPDSTDRQCTRVTYRRRTNGLHGLNGDRGFKVEPGKNLKEAKTDEHANRVYFTQGNIADEEGNKGTEITEGSRQLAQVIRIPAPMSFLPASHSSERVPRQVIRLATLHLSLLAAERR
jgi:hypothetical protein